MSNRDFLRNGSEWRYEQPSYESEYNTPLSHRRYPWYSLPSLPRLFTGIEERGETSSLPDIGNDNSLRGRLTLPDALSKTSSLPDIHTLPGAAQTTAESLAGHR